MPRVQSPFMTASPTTTRTAGPPAMDALLGRLRAVVDGGPVGSGTGDLVAAELRARTPTLGMLTATQRVGHPDRLTSHVLHAEDMFSVVALVWRPGQETPIHDHLAWCVVTVLSGTEQETSYRDQGDHLTASGQVTNATGSVTAIAPPGDIHRVRNDSDTTAISLHVYGTDLSVIGSSIRRVYDLPVV